MSPHALGQNVSPLAGELGRPRKTVLLSETFHNVRYAPCLWGSGSSYTEQSRSDEVIEAPGVTCDRRTSRVLEHGALAAADKTQGNGWRDEINPGRRTPPCLKPLWKWLLSLLDPSLLFRNWPNLSSSLLWASDEEPRPAFPRPPTPRGWTLGHHGLYGRLEIPFIGSINKPRCVSSEYAVP